MFIPAVLYSRKFKDAHQDCRHTTVVAMSACIPSTPAVAVCVIFSMTMTIISPSALPVQSELLLALAAAIVYFLVKLVHAHAYHFKQSTHAIVTEPVVMDEVVHITLKPIAHLGSPVGIQSPLHAFLCLLFWQSALCVCLL